LSFRISIASGLTPWRARFFYRSVLMSMWRARASRSSGTLRSIACRIMQVFLHRRRPPDALVVGEGLVVSCDQAKDAGGAAVAQDLDAEVPVEQQEAPALGRVPGHDRWLDDADLRDRGCDLGILRRPSGLRANHAEGLDAVERHAQSRCLEGASDRAAFFLPAHVNLLPHCRQRARPA
jgi:hypothetical protein